MIKYHNDLIQGTDEWRAARCGLLTASEMKHIITPAKLQYASNDKEKSHLYEILAQRITQYVEPQYISDDMMRGKDDELEAKLEYEKHYSRVQDVGFITNEISGFTLGCSPDGLVGEDGLIECKSRRQKFQIETILDGSMPEEYMLQVQTGLLVSGRKWCDFISYCGGMHMIVVRVEANKEIHEKIIAAATIFHDKLVSLLGKYAEKISYQALNKDRLIPTTRRVVQEITI